MRFHKRARAGVRVQGMMVRAFALMLGTVLALGVVLGVAPSTALADSAYERYVPEERDSESTLAEKRLKFNGAEWYIIQDNSDIFGNGTLTLLAADVLKKDETNYLLSAFNELEPSNNYSESTVMSMLDAMTAQGGSFANVAMAINTVRVKGSDNDSEVDAKLYLLSIEEANDLLKNVRKAGAVWWLRSPGTSYGSAAVVYGPGDASTDGVSTASDVGVRPACQLDLSSVDFESWTRTFKLNQGMYAVNNSSTSVTYAGHAQTYGDLAAVSDGDTLGTIGQSKRLEALTAKVSEGSIKYRSHVQGSGWEKSWAADGIVSGTIGQAKRIEAIQMTLADAGDSHVWYRVHSQTYGWLGWAHDGQPAGTVGQAKRIEAVEVVVLPAEADPATSLKDYREGQASYIGAATADVHLQKTGWTGAKSAVSFGTTGKSRRLEAIELSLTGQPLPGGIEYDVHVQGKGWVNDACDGELAGTTGEAKRLEAVRIRLTLGTQLESQCSVWYRVHSQTYGWLGWAHDGQEAGTTGLAKRAEAIDVQVLPKGQVPNGYDAGKAACITE